MRSRRPTGTTSRVITRIRIGGRGSSVWRRREHRTQASVEKGVVRDAGAGNFIFKPAVTSGQREDDWQTAQHRHVRQEILAALGEHGPLTKNNIEQIVRGASAATVRDVLQDLPTVPGSGVGVQPEPTTSKKTIATAARKRLQTTSSLSPSNSCTATKSATSSSPRR